MGRTRALAVQLVAGRRLRPVDQARGHVTHALRGPLLAVVLEEEGLVAGALAVPLVALAVRYPVVLVVAGTAATVATVALPGVAFEYDELALWTGTLVTSLWHSPSLGSSLSGKKRSDLEQGFFAHTPVPARPLIRNCEPLQGPGVYSL